MRHVEFLPVGSHQGSYVKEKADEKSCAAVGNDKLFLFLSRDVALSLDLFRAATFVDLCATASLVQPNLGSCPVEAATQIPSCLQVPIWGVRWQCICLAPLASMPANRGKMSCHSSSTAASLDRFQLDQVAEYFSSGWGVHSWIKLEHHVFWVGSATLSTGVASSSLLCNPVATDGKRGWEPEKPATASPEADTLSFTVNNPRTPVP